MGRLARVVAGVLFAALASAPASAHADLVSMTPADGSTVVDAPTSVTLTFSEDVQALGTTVAVLDARGNAMQAAQVMVQGAQARISLLPLTTAGEYRVNFRVLAADGHVVTGSQHFTYAPNAVPTPGVAPDAGGTSADVSQQRSLGMSGIVAWTAFLMMLAAIGFVLVRYLLHGRRG